jgi:hypothetical protein
MNPIIGRVPQSDSGLWLGTMLLVVATVVLFLAFNDEKIFDQPGNQHIEKEVSEPMTDTTAVMNKLSLSLVSLNTTRQQVLHFAERDGAATYALTQ